MQTITIASQKGGSGKTTIALHLATLAQADGPTILLDYDPQGSLTFWYERRDAKTPLLVKVGSNPLKDILDAARAEGIAYALIDTAPHNSAAMAEAMRPADLVVIPTRPSALDLHAVSPTLNMARSLKKKALPVLSQCPPKRGIGEPLAVREARDVIESMDAHAAGTFIAARAIAAQSVVAGLSVAELEPDGPSAKEFSQLWTEIKQNLEAPNG